MSAGDFVISTYETAAGNFAKIRVQPETLTLTIDSTANSAGAGPVNQQASAIANGSRRGIGVNARRVRLEWTGSPPTGYDPNGILTVPVLTPALFNAIDKGDEGTYLGAGVRVVGVTPEYVN
jgi:hypothetical protein